MIGRTLAHYRITAEIGAGGMGEVYRATDTKLGRDVALKVLPAEMASNPERLDRFRREAKALAALDHPGIVSIYSVEEADNVHFLTMQLVEGEPLDRLISKGALEAQRVVAIGSALAEALTAAHEKGIVHRDLKPGNVMVSCDGHVKVLDFGLAKMTATASDENSSSELQTDLQTRDTIVLGTVPYMSPEQVEGRPLDHRTDIYSFGVVLYEMATGQRPFRSASAAGLISAILRDTPLPITSFRPDLPVEIHRVIQACLQKNPEDRPQTIRGIFSGVKQEPAGSVPFGIRRTPSVVVLPFVNRSPDPGNEYFSDGLTEEIITDLSRIQALKVISRNSAMTLKGTVQDTPTLARNLKVTHVVSGSVRMAGEALRVTVELVEAESDAPIWSEKYAGTVADVFGIQEEIARKIVDALKVQLTDSEEQEAAKRPIKDIVAHDCYLRARQEIYGWTPESLERANILVDQAMDIVGENPLLLVTRGQIEWNIVNALFDPDERHLDEAAKCAQHALGLASDDAPGLFLRGLVAGMRGQTLEAFHDLLRARQLRPADPNIITEIVRFANASGFEVQEFVDEVIRLDPLTPVTWVVVCFHHFHNGRLEEAVLPARRSLELAPGVSMFHIFSAWTLAQAALRDEAITILEDVGKKLEGTVHGSWALFLRYALDGDDEQSSAQMTPLLERAASMQDHAARTIADGYSLIGRNEDALRWIRIGMDRGFINYPFLASHDPLLANVRQDPRFAELMEEVKSRWQNLAKAVPPPLRPAKYTP